MPSIQHKSIFWGAAVTWNLQLALSHAPQGLTIADFPVALLSYEAVSVVWWAGAWSTCYQLQPSKTVAGPVARLMPLSSRARTAELFTKAVGMAEAQVAKATWIARIPIVRSAERPRLVVSGVVHGQTSHISQRNGLHGTALPHHTAPALRPHTGVSSGEPRPPRGGEADQSRSEALGFLQRVCERHTAPQAIHDSIYASLLLLRVSRFLAYLSAECTCACRWSC